MDLTLWQKKTKKTKNKNHVRNPLKNKKKPEVSIPSALCQQAADQRAGAMNTNEHSRNGFVALHVLCLPFFVFCFFAFFLQQQQKSAK